MLQLYRFRYSTNVDRVSLALGHKGLAVTSVEIDPADRGEVQRVSGQPLVPVLIDGDRVVTDSMEIVRYLEERQPAPALYPAEPSRRAEMLLFIDWFNRVWKRLPNAIEAEMGKEHPDLTRIERLGAAIQGYLALFEQMLAGRDYLMGDELSAADCAVWPFVRYAEGRPADDPWLFHEVLERHQILGDAHPGVTGWLRRVSEHPMA